MQTGTSSTKQPTSTQPDKGGNLFSCLLQKTTSPSGRPQAQSHPNRGSQLRSGLKSEKSIVCIEEALSRSMGQIPASKKRRRIPHQKCKITLCSKQAGGRFVTRERPAGKPRGTQLQTATVTKSAAKFAHAKASRYSGSVQPQSNFTESYDRLGQS